MTATPVVKTTLWGMEYSVHPCPKQYRRELSSLFPTMDIDGILIVPTCQHAVVDLVKVGEKVEDEKDRLLERFMLWSSKICERLQKCGVWCDYIDPCSGLPMVNKDSNQVYGEVEGLSVLMGYRTANAGCCKILLHPRWGSSVYPATMFAKTSEEQLLEVIAQVEEEITTSGDA